MNRNGDRSKRETWTFLSNHGHVLVCLARDRQALLRDVAVNVGITERAVQQMVGDLERAGIIARVRVGRRNHYVVRREATMRHSLEAMVTVGDFLELFERTVGARAAQPANVPGSQMRVLQDPRPGSSPLRSVN